MINKQNDNFQDPLPTKWLGKPLHYEESIPSTNAFIKQALQQQADDLSSGMLVITDYQTQGKGQKQRNWIAPPYTSLLFSFLLKPNLPPQKSIQLTLITAVAMHHAIYDTTGLTTKIKYPNDIYIDNHKIAGILCEGEISSNATISMIIGVGCNVNQQEHDFPDSLRNKASSLALKSGILVNRRTLLVSFLKKMETYYKAFMNQGLKPFLPILEKHALLQNKWVVADGKRGQVQGLTQEGYLRLKAIDGHEFHHFSGDIVFDLNDSNDLSTGEL